MSYIVTLLEPSPANNPILVPNNGITVRAAVSGPTGTQRVLLRLSQGGIGISEEEIFDANADKVFHKDNFLPPCSSGQGTPFELGVFAEFNSQTGSTDPLEVSTEVFGFRGVCVARGRGKSPKVENARLKKSGKQKKGKKKGASPTAPETKAE